MNLENVTLSEKKISDKVVHMIPIFGYKLFKIGKSVGKK